MSDIGKKIYHKKLMNTDFMITTYSYDTQKVDTLVSKAFVEVENLITKYSRFDENSQLSKLNKSSEERNEITEEMYNFCNFGIEIAKLTNGIFDFTVVDLLNAIGYKKSYKDGMNYEQKSIPEIQEIIKTRKSYKDISTSVENGKFYLIKPVGTMLDFGGFLKGYSVDLVWNILRPLKNYLIDAGGDIRCNGNAYKNNNWENWKIGLWNFEKPITEYISLESGNVFVCSGANSKKFGELSHIVNLQEISFKQSYTLTFTHGDAEKIKIKIPGIKFETPTTISDVYSTVSYIMGARFIEVKPIGIEVLFR